MSDHVTMTTTYGEYRTDVLHTDVALHDQDDEHPTEWFVFKGDEMLKTGWGGTPRKADEQAKTALNEILTASNHSEV